MSQSSEGKLKIQCPTCQASLMASQKMAGKRVACPSCTTPLTVPAAVQPPDVPTNPDWWKLEEDAYPPSRRHSQPSSAHSHYEDEFDDEHEFDDDEVRRPARRQRGFRCPYCGSGAMPDVRNRISQTGWVVFILLLLFCFPLCIIGLLIKEDYRQCYECGMKLG